MACRSRCVRTHLDRTVGKLVHKYFLVVVQCALHANQKVRVYQLPINPVRVCGSLTNWGTLRWYKCVFLGTPVPVIIVHWPIIAFRDVWLSVGAVSLTVFVGGPLLLLLVLLLLLQTMPSYDPKMVQPMHDCGPCTAYHYLNKPVFAAAAAAAAAVAATPTATDSPYDPKMVQPMQK